jgi:predicted nucleic acid-binding protein
VELTLLDSSVWIDLLRDRQTAQVAEARRLLDAGAPLAMGDLVLVELLQGTRDERHLAQVASFSDQFRPVRIADHQVAVVASRHYHALRQRGITPRKTIDTLIATRCIIDGIPLLYSDRDFDPFVRHLGLRSALDLPGVN